MGIGIAIGLALGLLYAIFILGPMMGNPGAGIAIGIAIGAGTGVGIGAVFEERDRLGGHMSSRNKRFAAFAMIVLGVLMLLVFGAFMFLR